MLINQVNINKFNSQILKVDIQNSNLNDDDKSLLKSELGISESCLSLGINVIEVELLINSEAKKQYYIDKSNLLKLMSKPFELYLIDRDLRFRCKLINHINKASLREIRGRFILTMYGVNQGDEKVEILKNIQSKVFNVPGNCNINCILEITPNIDMIDLTIEGLTEEAININNLRKDKKIIFNSDEGTVLEEGKNKFNDTDFWEFPFLVPGTNKVILSKSNCNVTIKYKSRYI